MRNMNKFFGTTIVFFLIHYFHLNITERYTIFYSTNIGAFKSVVLNKRNVKTMDIHFLCVFLNQFYAQTFSRFFSKNTGGIKDAQPQKEDPLFYAFGSISLIKNFLLLFEWLTTSVWCNDKNMYWLKMRIKKIWLEIKFVRASRLKGDLYLIRNVYTVNIDIFWEINEILQDTVNKHCQ